MAPTEEEVLQAYASRFLRLLGREDICAMVNYVFAAFQVVLTCFVLMTWELGKQVPSIQTPLLTRTQEVVADMTLAGFLLHVVLFFSKVRTPEPTIPMAREARRRSVRDVGMMTILFGVLTMTYFTMSTDNTVVHEFPVSASLGGDNLVYSVRYIEWCISTPFICMALQNCGLTADGHHINGDLLAAGLNTSASCLICWAGSVLKNLPWAYAFITISWMAYPLIYWQAWLHRRNVRKSKSGRVKLVMVYFLLVIFTWYGALYNLGQYGNLSAENEQILWCLSDLCTKLTWATCLTIARQLDETAIAEMTREARCKEELVLEKALAADNAKQELALVKKIREAVDAVQELTHPLILVPAAAFLEQVTVDRIEALQDTFKARTLRVLDTVDEVKAFKAKGAIIIFFSYECLQFGKVAPNEVQLQSMKAALTEAATLLRTVVDKVYIWLDCFSVPQKNKFLKKAAINALYTYASIADMLIIVCPTSVHASTNKLANVETMRKRFWCRVEQLAYFCKQGRANMLLHQGARLEPVPDNWMDAVCCVCQGDTTCCRIEHVHNRGCDRESAVLPLLALYYDVYDRVVNSKDDMSDKDRAVWELIKRRKDGMFPKQFMYKYKGEEVIQDLFGQMIERLEHMIEKRKLTGQTLAQVLVDDSISEKAEETGLITK